MKKLAKPIFNKIISGLMINIFVFSSVITPGAFAQSVPSFLNLPAPGAMLTSTAAYNPALIMGVNIRPEDSLMFDFIIDKADSGLEGEAFNAEANKLIKYFLAALTTPQEQMWVNLSPYESGRIIPEIFGRTEMGRDMLAQDYILKQLSASLLSPEEALGGEFWNRFQAKAQAQFGSSDIPLSVFNKIWIVPSTASIYEHSKGAYIVESHLDVMLEQDYLALEVNRDSTEHGLGAVSDADLNQITGVAADIIREVLLPEIEREVNQGRLFAPLRQIMHSMLLAKWYKDNLKESLLGQVYADRGKTNGVDADPAANQQIYNAYLKAFETGAYNYVKETYDPTAQAVIPKKYFSGGITSQAMMTETTTRSEASILSGNRDLAIVSARAKQTDAAMTSTLNPKFDYEPYHEVNFLKQTHLDNIIYNKRDNPSFTGLVFPFTDHDEWRNADGYLGVFQEIVSPEKKYQDRKKDKYFGAIEIMRQILISDIGTNDGQLIIVNSSYSYEEYTSEFDRVADLYGPKYIKSHRKLNEFQWYMAGLNYMLTVVGGTVMANKSSYIASATQLRYIANTALGILARSIDSAEKKNLTLFVSNLLALMIDLRIDVSALEVSELNLSEQLRTAIEESRIYSQRPAYEVFESAFTLTDLTPKLEPDAAMTATPTGGIDFNPDAVRMQVFNDGEGFTVIPPSIAEIEQFMSNNGFIPVIINVQPVANLPLLLGMTDKTNTDSTVISRL